MESGESGVEPALQVISAGAARGLLSALGDRLAAALGGPVDAAFGPVGQVDAWLQTGRACDVVITSEPRLAALVADGLVAESSVRPLGTVATALAAGNGGAATALGDAVALTALVRSAPRIHCNDPEKATAGRHFVGVLERLSVLDAVRDRLVIHPDGAATMRALAEDGLTGSIGCAQATEIAAESGVQSLGTLPGDFALATGYLGFVRAGAQRPDDARLFLDILCGDDARTLRHSLGFDAEK